MPPRPLSLAVTAGGLLVASSATAADIDAKTLDTVCRYVAAIEPSDIKDYTVRSGVFDVNGDGVAETVTGTYDGTMAIETADIRAADDSTVELSPTYDWSEYWTVGQRWLLFDGRAYLLNFVESGGLFLKFLSYVDRQYNEHLGCEFDTDVKETVIADRTEFAALCEAVGSNGLTPLPVDAVEEEPVDREDTSLAGRIARDFDNDGTVEKLASLHFSSGAGSGCDANYFDLEDALGGSPDADKRDLLLRLQSVDLSDRYPARPCSGVGRRWLESDGRAYLELRYQGDAPEGDSQAIHWVATVENGAPVQACHSSFRMRWLLTAVTPPE